jgi:hypothetical protein
VKKHLLVFSLFLMMVAGAVQAAGPGAPFPRGKWWRRSDVAQQLTLSTDQQLRLDGIFRGASSELIDLRGEAEKLSISLRNELDQPTLNRENLRKLANRLSDTQGKLFERELMMLADMRGVLSEEQWTRLRSELERERLQPGDRRMAPRQ